MSEIFQWVRDIFIIIISLTFFQILLPDSTMTKYVNSYNNSSAGHNFFRSIIILGVRLCLKK